MLLISDINQPKTDNAVMKGGSVLKCLWAVCEVSTRRGMSENGGDVGTSHTAQRLSGSHHFSIPDSTILN